MKEVAFSLKEKLGKNGTSEQEVGKQVETERRTLFHMGNKREALGYQIEFDLAKLYHILGRVAKLQADALQKHYRPPIARVRHNLKFLLANICILLLLHVTRNSVFIFPLGSPW